MRHSGSTPLSESQAAVSQLSKPGPEAGASDGGGGASASALTSMRSSSTPCLTSVRVLSLTKTELKLSQDTAPKGALAFSVDSNTRIVGTVAPDQTVNVCYLIRDGRNVATEITGSSPEPTDRRVLEYDPDYWSQSGVVSVISVPPGADIEVDGAFLGSTPSELPLNLGEHVVTITKKGFKPFQRKLRVIPGAKQTVSAELEPGQ